MEHWYQHQPFCFHSHPWQNLPEVNRCISWRSPSPWKLVMFYAWCDQMMGCILMECFGSFRNYQLLFLRWEHGVSLLGLGPRCGEINGIKNMKHSPMLIKLHHNLMCCHGPTSGNAVSTMPFRDLLFSICEPCEGGRAKRCHLQQRHGQSWPGSEYNEIGSDYNEIDL